MDGLAEAITIPPLKRDGDNKEEHHVTCTYWIPLYIHTRKSAHKYVLQLNMYTEQQMKRIFCIIGIVYE